jgi:catechol 2,3-dioxygenase-like lactoylglutathione lyase family enzyme
MKFRSIVRKGRLLVPLLLVSLLVACAAAGCSSPAPVVKKVDHVVVMVGDPQELFTFFTQTLGLKTAWPLAAYPQYSTAGVQAGSVNIELLHGGPPAAPTAAAAGITAKAFYYGIVFAPYPLTTSVPELEARGAQPGKPVIQTGEFGGKTVPMWTNVTLKALCKSDYIVYLCQYTPQVAARMASKTSTGPVGKIGLESVREISLTSTDPSALQATWKKALAPAPMSSDGVMTLGNGPAVRISKGGSDRFESLLLEVASLSEAKSFLEKNGLLGESTNNQISIDPAKVQGLDIRIVQKQ